MWQSAVLQKVQSVSAALIPPATSFQPLSSRSPNVSFESLSFVTRLFFFTKGLLSKVPFRPWIRSGAGWHTALSGSIRFLLSHNREPIPQAGSRRVGQQPRSATASPDFRCSSWDSNCYAISERSCNKCRSKCSDLRQHLPRPAPAACDRDGPAFPSRVSVLLKSFSSREVSFLCPPDLNRSKAG